MLFFSSINDVIIINIRNLIEYRVNIWFIDWFKMSGIMISISISNRIKIIIINIKFIDKLIFELFILLNPDSILNL